MEQTKIDNVQPEISLRKAFIAAAIGAAICVVSSVFDIIMVVKETDSLDTIMNLTEILGLIVWGGALIAAGTALCRMGHTETGVRTAGGALILTAIICIIMMFAIKEDTEPLSVKNIIFSVLYLGGLAIFYFALKQEDDDEDKSFGMAAIGIGMVAFAYILGYVAYLLAEKYMEGHGVSFRLSGDGIEVEYSKGFAIGKWIADNHKLVMIILASLTTLGYLGAFLNMCTYNDSVQDIEDEKEEEKDLEILNEVIEEYKKRKETETKTETDAKPDEN